LSPPLAPNECVAVILAGGFGTRIQHLLQHLPKPMAPVNGRPFVEWAVRYLAKQGIRRVVLATGHLAETVEHHFESRPVRGVRVRCVAETTPLGTAGGFRNAAVGSGESAQAWLVLNGDSLALASLEPMFQALADEGVEGALLGVPMPDASRYGTIERNASGDLIGFNEKRPGAGVINAGVYLFRESLVRLFPSRAPLSFEQDVFPALAARGVRLKVCVTQAPFLDIGTPESLPLAEAFVRENAAFFES
jgi:D-glycero-alpha-D-manno-heptose 1-phosphate guanylyltransferase